jgi:hypothetical protein
MTGNWGTSIRKFPYSSQPENAQIPAHVEHKRGTGELGDFAVSVEIKMKMN